MWTIAKVKDGFADFPNERFHTFAILKDREVVGKLRYDGSRWKSAGGPAWQGTLFKTSLHGSIGSGPNCAGRAYHNKDKSKVLAWFKTGKCA
jgi:hypothetical protein